MNGPHQVPLSALYLELFHQIEYRGPQRSNRPQSTAFGGRDIELSTHGFESGVPGA